MKLLHTSDWHLGRSFHGVGLLGAQASFVDHLVDVVRSERVDAVLVSGDVYDRALPAPDTVALLSQSLERLVDAGAQVVLSSGNHDSAIRLGFAGGLLSRAGVHVRTSLEGIGTPVLLGDVAVHPLPYLEPSVVADALGARERTHASVLRAAMARVSADATPAHHRVVMAHAFVTGATGSDSERDISVGGVSAVPAAVFDGMSYAALGHLHGQQQVGEFARFSGSPVAMSFSEQAHVKGSLLVDLGGRTPEITAIPAPVERPLAVVRGALEEVLTDPRWASAEGAWCQVTLTDSQRPLGAMDRVRRRFPHTLELRFEPASGVVVPTSYAARVKERSDLDVCCDFLGHVRGGAGPTERERALLAEAVESARLERGADDDEGRAATDAAAREVGAA